MNKFTLSTLLAVFAVSSMACAGSDAPSIPESAVNQNALDESTLATEEADLGRKTSASSNTPAAAAKGGDVTTDLCAGVVCGAGTKCYQVPQDNGGGRLAANVAAGAKQHLCAEPCKLPLVNIITPGYYSSTPTSSCGETQAAPISNHRQGGKTK
jgi:hypothetical protein